jgi:hypothetical protein
VWLTQLAPTRGHRAFGAIACSYRVSNRDPPAYRWVVSKQCVANQTGVRFLDGRQENGNCRGHAESGTEGERIGR